MSVGSMKLTFPAESVLTAVLFRCCRRSLAKVFLKSVSVLGVYRKLRSTMDFICPLINERLHTMKPEIIISLPVAAVSTTEVVV
jgi:hypothetical protein